MAQSYNFGSLVDKAAEWKKMELAKLTDFIQQRLHKLQHPESCKNAK